MDQINVNSKAIDFTIALDNGTDFTLSNHGKNAVVLFFYPKDDTKGCTQEALEFSQLKQQFDDLNVALLGISPDSIKKHISFKNKYNLTVDLGSDESKDILQSYGVWVEKSMYGRKYMGVERTTILIDSNLNILKIWHKVKVANHAAEVLATVKNIISHG
ncbi:peroxiredoxin [Bartonella sp. DGB1]|uniref:peroxiredoxin n=1 Tax=Bartonella sp. DGB1 TaxID=3239807 RepID=UPI0035239E9D